MLGEAFLECKFTKGLFEDERIVQLTIGGITYTTFADKEDLKGDQELLGEEWIDGRLKVYVTRVFDNDMSLVNLPREAAGNGRVLAVPKTLLLQNDP